MRRSRRPALPPHRGEKEDREEDESENGDIRQWASLCGLGW
jgi:hypothetical protein